MNTFSGYVKATSRPALFFLLLLLFFYVYEMVYKTAETSYLTFNIPKLPVSLMRGSEGGDVTCPPPPVHCPQSQEERENIYRLHLAKIIDEVEQEISKVAGGEAMVEARWGRRLQALVEELDPRAVVPDPATWPYSARLPDMGPAPPAKFPRHVCPEIYYGNKFDHPLSQHGMEPEDCQYVPPFSTVLTVVLPATTWPPHITNLVISNLRKLYQVPIIVIVNSAIVVQSNINITIFTPTKTSLSESDVLNQALKQVTTPYVFLASGLNHFSNQSSLERLVRVLDELPHVAVAAGAARDIHGHWQHGCLQHRMADYQATYTLGYYYSSHECMYCDDLLTPFVTSTALLHHLPLPSGLSGPVLYRHWLAQVRAAGHLAIVCPDVMFFVAQHVNMTPSDWQQLGHLWSLQTITSYTDQVHNFSCGDVGIFCKEAQDMNSWLLLPPCCRALMEKELSYILDYSEQHNLHYELQAGSVLAAITMGHYPPWDTDISITIQQKDYAKWLDMEKQYLREKQCNLNISKPKANFTIVCPYLSVSVSVTEVSSRQLLPSQFHNLPTEVEYGGRWTAVPTNPGLHARQNMGREVLKHWGTTKMPHPDLSNSTRVWPRCRNTGHHSCLDIYPSDGSLPFLRPFLHP